ncbi:MAG: hypothetical protein BDTLLHRC_000210 [Candidatus Fervidibacter sp.]|jgi:nitrite transporter NirC
MYRDTLQQIAEVAAGKAALARSQALAFVMHSALAGVYVGFGVVLVCSLAAPLARTNPAVIPTLMAAAFGVALSLVIVAGADLFTGNNMVMTVGVLTKQAGWGDLLRVWALSYLGNFVGAMMLALMVAKSGTLASAPALWLLEQMATKKMSLSASEAFLRGILCNWLVCLAVWVAFRLRSEAAKLIMVFWCLMAFVGSGFEHSVANMTLLTLANFLSDQPAISWLGMVRNLMPVTLGNIIGGALFVGMTYWLVTSVHSLERQPS